MVKAAVVVAAVLAALGGCKDEAKIREGEMTQLLALLPGEYDNRAQVALDARNGARPSHDPVTLIITRVFTPRLGHHTYYAQEIVTDDPRRVLGEKMYSFQVDEKRGIIETTYAFVEPLRWRDGQQNKDLFTSVVTEDVQPEACDLIWKGEAGHFVATHDPKACPDPGGAAVTQAEFSAGALTLGDYKLRKVR
ncbi:MAG: CpcT/CpeT family chromophore lyase [Steroidobacterales bacterium]|jgi:hypothetical protein